MNDKIQTEENICMSYTVPFNKEHEPKFKWADDSNKPFKDAETAGGSHESSEVHI